MLCTDQKGIVREVRACQRPTALSLPSISDDFYSTQHDSPIILCSLLTRLRWRSGPSRQIIDTVAGKSWLTANMVNLLGIFIDIHHCEQMKSGFTRVLLLTAVL